MLLPRVQGGLAALFVAFAIADEAHAVTHVRVIGTTLAITADPGRDNRIRLIDAGADVEVSDFNDNVVPGPGCVFVNAGTASCPRAGFARARAVSGDGNDWVLSFSSVPIQLFGGDGGDVLRGGTGDDFFDGGTGADAMYGDAGTDSVSYAAKPAGVQVTLDNTANDGVAGEGDNVNPTIENVTGSSSPDLIIGSAVDNVLGGNGGNDRLFGGDGNDTFPTPFLDGADEHNGGAGADHVDYTGRANPVVVQLDGLASDGEGGEGDNVRLDVEDVTGGNRNDALLGSVFDNRLHGGLGDDLLDGRAGNDTLIGGGGLDRLYGGFGNDRLNGVDGAAGDLLYGQQDFDFCTSDAGDTELACEA
jgi:Ca2+-binding RTX toxin-like protein